MREGNIFSLFTLAGGGYPIPGPDGRVHHPADGEGGTTSMVWRGGYPVPGPDRGVPCPRSGWGVPHPADGEVPPSKIRMGVPPCPRLDGVPPIQDCMGYLPLSKTAWGPPHQKTDQQNKHLLCGRQCASCIHTGGLSCFLLFSLN